MSDEQTEGTGTPEPDEAAQGAADAAQGTADAAGAAAEGTEPETGSDGDEGGEPEAEPAE